MTSPSLAVAVLEHSPGYWRSVLSRLLRDKVALGAGTAVLILLIMAILGPLLAPADPYQPSMLSRLKPIGSAGYLLGSDELGRDMLSRLIVGARLSLFMGLTPVFLAFFIGTAIGLLAGYSGGWVNSVIMRTVDVFYAFPSVLLAIALSGALGAGIFNSLISLTMVCMSCRVSGATVKSAKRAASRATRRIRTGSSRKAVVTWRNTLLARSA